jgi:hypothetical protein
MDDLSASDAGHIALPFRESYNSGFSTKTGDLKWYAVEEPSLPALGRQR